jgi:hypothetical protein
MNDSKTAFGFSFESEDEITSIAKKITEQAQTQIQEISAVVNTKSAQVATLHDQLQEIRNKHEGTQNKLALVIDLIRPFLDNLAAEPEKVYIKWPDRAQKIKEFKDKLDSIIKGD